MLKKTKYYVALIKNQVDPTLDTMYNEKYIVINKKNAWAMFNSWHAVRIKLEMERQDSQR